MATYTPKLKWTWESIQLKINTTFEDVQMMLKWFYHFSPGVRFSKFSVECFFHICSCSCPNVRIIHNSIYLVIILVGDHAKIALIFDAWIANLFFSQRHLCSRQRINRADSFCLWIMAVRVVEFSSGGYKIRKIFA